MATPVEPEVYWPGQWLRLWVLPLPNVQVLPFEQLELRADRPLLNLLAGEPLPWDPACIDQDVGGGLGHLAESDESDASDDSDFESADDGDEREDGSEGEGEGEGAREAAGDSADEPEDDAQLQEAMADAPLPPLPPPLHRRDPANANAVAALLELDDPVVPNAEELWRYLCHAERARRVSRDTPLPLAVAQTALQAEGDRPEMGVLVDTVGHGGRGKVQCRGGARVAIYALVPSSVSVWHLGLGQVQGETLRGAPWAGSVPPPPLAHEHMRTRQPQAHPLLQRRYSRHYAHLAAAPWALRLYDAYALVAHATRTLHALVNLGAGVDAEREAAAGGDGSGDRAGEGEGDGNGAALPAVEGPALRADAAVVAPCKAMPREPVAACFFLANLLPLSTKERSDLLRWPSTVRRLRFLDAVMTRMQESATLDCIHCGSEVTDVSQVFVARNKASALGTFVNPHGFVHQICTVHAARNLEAATIPTLADTWFPGYAWTILVCSVCQSHVGWRYDMDPVEAAASPNRLARFYGLLRSVLVLQRAPEPSSADVMLA